MIPQAKHAVPVLGHIPALSRGQNGCFYDAIVRLNDKSPITEIHLAGQRCYLIADAELAKEMLGPRRESFPKGNTLTEMKAFGMATKGLTFSEGENWSAQRKSLQSSFSPSHVATLLPKLERHIEKFCALVKNRPSVEVGSAFERLIMSTLCDHLFSMSSKALDDLETEDFLIARQHYATEQVTIRFKRTPLWKYLPLPSNFKVKRLVAEQREFFNSMIRERRASGETKNDYLQVLLQLSNDEEYIGDQLQTFLGAGFESSAASLHWLFYYLSQHPELDQRVHAEVSEFFARSPKPPLAEAARLELLHFVIKETLRLRPPFPLIAREVAKETTIGEYTLKKGATALFLLGEMHTHVPAWGADAHEFKPERFGKPESRSIESTWYNPFGIGNRYCIGNHFATQQIAVIVAKILQRYRVELVPGQTITPIYRFSWISFQGIRLKFIERSTV